MQSILGILIFIVIAWLVRLDNRPLPKKTIIIGLSLQFVLALVLTKLPGLEKAFLVLNQVVVTIDEASKHGAQFMFGFLAGGELPYQEVLPGKSFVLAFQVLPMIIVVSALSAGLYHLGVLQKLIYSFAWMLQKTLKTEPISSITVASSIFLGIIETPILVRPYLSRLSPQGLFLMFTASMATVSGTVMILYSNIIQSIFQNPTQHILIASIISAPAAILFAQIIFQNSEFNSNENIKLNSPYKSFFDSLISGTKEGLEMVFSIASIIIVIFAFIFILNKFLNFVSFGNIDSVIVLASYFFAPFCWLMGIPWTEALSAGELMATKTLLNEFVAYLNFSQLPANTFSETSKLILLYSLCGFANLGSMGILIGGLSQILPEKKSMIAQLATKSLIAGTLSTMTTGAVIGLIS